MTYCFAWMNFFTGSMLFPAAVGLLMHILKPENGWTVDHHPYLPFYSLVIVVWVMVLVKNWRRRSNEIACRWGTLAEPTGDAGLASESTRPEFRGDFVRAQLQARNRRYSLHLLATSSMHSAFS